MKPVKLSEEFKKTQCEECLRYRHRHTIYCSKTDKDDLIEVIEDLEKEKRDSGARINSFMKRVKAEENVLRAKVFQLKHENNKLRQKVWKQNNDTT